MAVYTKLSDEEIKHLMNRWYGLTVQAVAPVAEGIENSIYRLVCESGRNFALVIFETQSVELVENYARVLEQLKSALQQKVTGLNVQVPAGLPLKQDCNRQYVAIISSQTTSTNFAKPAVVQPWIEGQHQQADAAQCFQLGAFLGVMNSMTPQRVPGAVIPQHQHLIRIQKVQSNLAAHPKEMQNSFERMWSSLGHIVVEHENLTPGLVHGDLFIDNALFQDDNLSGVIDFFNASWSPKLLDLAICLMDWCIKKNRFDETLCRNLVRGFRQECDPVAKIDLDFWPDLIRLAAFRFWCTRHEYYLACQTRGITPVQNRDPAFCEKVFVQVDSQKKMLVDLWR